jgi:hypothetical protein
MKYDELVATVWDRGEYPSRDQARQVAESVFA